MLLGRHGKVSKWCLITFLKKIQKRWFLWYSIKSCSFKNLQYSQGKRKHLRWSLFLIQNTVKLLRAPSLTNIFERLLLQMCTWNWEIFRSSGVQAVIFQSRGRFVKLGHFGKLFFKNTREKLSQGNILKLFFLDTLKTRFWMEGSTQRWTQFSPIFENQDTFSDCQKKKGKSPSNPTSHSPLCCPPELKNYS